MRLAVRDAFVGEGELNERQGSVLVVASGVLFSVTAIAFAAVEEASDFQFLAYRVSGRTSRNRRTRARHGGGGKYQPDTSTLGNGHTMDLRVSGDLAEQALIW